MVPTFGAYQAVGLILIFPLLSAAALGAWVLSRALPVRPPAQQPLCSSPVLPVPVAPADFGTFSAACGGRKAPWGGL